MRTTDDLRAVFADLESGAPTELRDPAKVLAAPRSRYRVLAAAAVVLIVACIAIGFTLSRHGTSTRPARPHPQPSQSSCGPNAHCPVLDEHGNPVPLPSSFSLGLAAMPGLRLQTHELTPTTETLTVGSGLQTVTVTDYAAGSAPKAARLGKASVPGHAAYYVTTANSTPSGSPQYDSIMWTAAGRTVLVQAQDAGNAVLLRVATAVRAMSQPITLPFRFGRLPTELVPESIAVGLDKDSPGGIFAEVGFTDGDLTQQSDNFYVGSAAIAVAAGVEPGLDGANHIGTTADGHGIYTGGKQPWGESTTVQVLLNAHNAAILLPNPARLNTYSAADLTNIASQMSFAANPKDPATWFTTNLFPS
jgi:hypothetical protein